MTKPLPLAFFMSVAAEGRGSRAGRAAGGATSKPWSGAAMVTNTIDFGLLFHTGKCPERLSL